MQSQFAKKQMQISSYGCRHAHSPGTPRQSRFFFPYRHKCLPFLRIKKANVSRISNFRFCEFRSYSQHGFGMAFTWTNVQKWQNKVLTNIKTHYFPKWSIFDHFRWLCTITFNMIFAAVPSPDNVGTIWEHDICIQTIKALIISILQSHF